MLQPFGHGHAGVVEPSRLVLQPHHSGRPLPPGLRGTLEGLLGTDLSAVRIHLGPQPDALGAQAFTTGDDIYVAPYRFAPDSPAGRRLLGHEVAHVVQQRQGRVRVPPSQGGLVLVQDPGLEREAEQLAGRVAAAPVASLRAPAPRPASPHPGRPGAVQRMKRNEKDDDKYERKNPTAQKKKKLLTTFPANNLPDYLLLYIFNFLSNLDILQLFRVSKRFHELALRFFLPTSFYTQDTEPIVGRGMTQGTVVSAQEHWSHAAAAFRLALSIRNRKFSKGKVPRILLYRVSDKHNLNSAETMALTVPGNPSNSKQYIPQLKKQELYNFQVHGRDKSFWSVEKTGAWILGGIVARLPFVLVTKPTDSENFKEGDVRNRNVSQTVAIYAREIMQLLEAGYTLGFSTEGQRPKELSSNPNVLVLLPPSRRTYRTLYNEMSSTTSYLNRDTIWNRQVKDPTALTITVNGRKITAEALANYIQEELALLRKVANLLAEDEMEESELVLGTTGLQRTLDQVIESTNGNEEQLLVILGRLSLQQRAQLRNSYQEDLDLELGYEGRVSASIQRKVIKVIKKMDG